MRKGTHNPHSTYTKNSFYQVYSKGNSQTSLKTPFVLLLYANINNQGRKKQKVLCYISDEYPPQDNRPAF